MLKMGVGVMEKDPPPAFLPWPGGWGKQPLGQAPPDGSISPLGPLRQRQGFNQGGSERMREGTNECCGEQMAQLHVWNWAAGNVVRAP